MKVEPLCVLCMSCMNMYEVDVDVLRDVASSRKACVILSPDYIFFLALGLR